MLPPNLYVLVRGSSVVLAACAVGSGALGGVLGDPVIALNSLGFVGTCALSCTAIFYSVALERIGVTAALQAARKIVTVLAVSAGVAAVILVSLLSQARFRDEASHVGVHSVAGIVVLVILLGVGTVLWRDG